jgi:hypothetical protein
MEIPLSTDPAIRLVGAPRLVLERGASVAIAAALDALDPDDLASPEAMADAVETAARVQRWATTRAGERDPIAVRAGQVARRAVGRLAVYGAEGPGSRWAAVARARAWGPAPAVAELPKSGGCPPGEVPTLEAGLAGLDAEPAPAGGAVELCWEAFVSNTVNLASRSSDPVALARAVLAFAERPHRAAVAASLADRLRQRVQLYPKGGIVLPTEIADDRAARSIVYAALLRAVRLGKPSAAPAARFVAWIGVQRDARGGYGSSLATRSVVRALLASAEDRPEKTRVHVSAAGLDREIVVGPSALLSVPLDPRTTELRLDATGPGVIARVERPGLRLWSRPPAASASPVHVELTWPDHPRAGKTGVLRISLRQELGRAAIVDTRIPLPPGVSLGAAVTGVRQVQGALSIRSTLDDSQLPTTVDIPLRFGLAGKVTAPEARSRVAFEEHPAAIAPARALRIE